MAKIEAVIMVRIDEMDRQVTLGSRAICLPLDEIGPETVDEWVAAALRAASSLDAAGQLPGWSTT